MPLTNHVAIFGGSFDPPHIGHQITCLWLASALNAKIIEIAPTFEHCFGKRLADFNHRVKMCELMAERLDSGYDSVDDDRVVRVRATAIEKYLPKPNITYNLVNAYINSHWNDYDCAVIIGSDLVPDLHKWVKWDEVAKIAKVIAVGRSGFDKAKTPLEIYQYPIELSAVSSSDVRTKIKNGEDITGLVPSNVKEYIYENGLYT